MQLSSKNYLILCLFFFNWTRFSLLICNSFKYSGILLAVTFTFIRGFPGGSVVKKVPAMQETQETWVRSLGQEDALEEGMATHSSILAWRIPWTEEPGRLWSDRKSVV